MVPITSTAPAPSTNRSQSLVEELSLDSERLEERIISESMMVKVVAEGVSSSLVPLAKVKTALSVHSISSEGERLA